MPKDFTSRIILTADSRVGPAYDRTAKATGRLTQSLRGVGRAAAAAGSAAAGAFGAHAIRVQKDFASSVSELSAITGATGSDLNFLSEAAKEFGRSTTLSATDSVRAFKLVASAKPDLLSNNEALREVTANVITLAEASGEDLTASAETVGQALNQFGAGADQASRFVNVLAAGSKFGSSEIGTTSAALVKAGVAANAAGLSFEDTNAALQLLATGGTKGAEAGTALRAILVRLQQQSNDQFNPAIVGAEQALLNLQAAELSNTDQIKLFGREQFALGKILIDGAMQFGDLRNSITGTNVASEQAVTRNQNLEGQMKRAGSAVEGLAIEVGSRLTPSVAAAATIMATLVNEITDGIGPTDDGTDNFVLMDKVLRTLFASGRLVGAAFQALGSYIGGVAASLVLLVQGEFAGAAKAFEQSGRDITSAIGDGIGDAYDLIVGDTQNILGNIDSADAAATAKTAGMNLGMAIQTGVTEATGSLITDVVTTPLTEGSAGEDARNAGTQIGQRLCEGITAATCDAGKIVGGEDSQPDTTAAYEAGVAMGNARIEGQISAENVGNELFSQTQASLDEIRQTAATERMSTDALAFDNFLARKTESLGLAQNTELDMLQSFLDQKVDLETSAAQTIKEITNQEKEEETDNNMKSALQNTQFALGQIQNLTAGAAKESKAAFIINKAASLANAGINIAQGITAALASAPPPINIALAAITAAAGAVQIATIASQKFGGKPGAPRVSGGGGAGAIARSAPAVPPPSVEGAAGTLGSGGGPARLIDIQIQGLNTAGLLPAETVRTLIESINEELGDGANLNIAGAT